MKNHTVNTAIINGLIKAPAAPTARRRHTAAPTLCSYRSRDYLSTPETLRTLHLSKSASIKNLTRYGLHPVRLAGKNPAALYWHAPSVRRVAAERQELFAAPPATEYYTAADAAALLHKSRAGLTRMVQMGQLSQLIRLLRSDPRSNARRKVSFFPRKQVDTLAGL